MSDDPRFKVVEIKCLHANCWGARCTACKAWLTKHAWDAEGAAMEAVDALERADRWRHVCPKG